MLAAILWPASPQPVAAQQFGLPPVERQIRIISPANHAVFYSPVDISIFAYAHGEGVDATAAFTNVEFFANGVDLGSGINLGTAHAGMKPIFADFVIANPVARLGSVYCFVWTNAPVGSYALTAVAQGRELLTSLSRTSAPVNITILASSTQPNPTDIVSIVATDPIAIAARTPTGSGRGRQTRSRPGRTGRRAKWQNFTNWGPKDALFTVRRFGDASSSLTVNYSIGGTASNGVDYAELPGTVAIPARGPVR